MWDLPGPGREPVSPALAGGFLTTAPPGKPPYLPLDALTWGAESLTHQMEVKPPLMINQVTQNMKSFQSLIVLLNLVKLGLGREGWSPALCWVS